VALSASPASSPTSAFPQPYSSEAAIHPARAKLTNFFFILSFITVPNSYFLSKLNSIKNITRLAPSASQPQEEKTGSPEMDAGFENYGFARYPLTAPPVTPST
jgi:hypothetical protein